MGCGTRDDKHSLRSSIVPDSGSDSGRDRQQEESKEYHGLKRKAKNALKKNSIISKLCSQTSC